MTLTGGCFCGAIRYEISSEIPFRALCLCKTCQKFSGGAGNLFVGIEAEAFRYTRGEPRSYTRPNADVAPTREFCGECGVHLAGRLKQIPEGVVVRIGTLDDPSAFEGPDMVFWADEKQGFHLIPEGATVYGSLPNR